MTNPDPTLEAARQAVLRARADLAEADREIKRFTDLKRTASGTNYTRAVVMLDEWTKRRETRAAIERQCAAHYGDLLLIAEGFSYVR